MCEYKTKYGPLPSLHWGQLAQSWASWHSSCKALGDTVVVIYKKLILFLRRHGSNKGHHFSRTRPTAFLMLLRCPWLDIKAGFMALYLTFTKYCQKYLKSHNATVDTYTNNEYLPSLHTLLFYHYITTWWQL